MADQLSLLRIYLRDHEAAGVGGLRLFQRCCKANRGTPYAAELQRLTDEIGSDLDALRRICRLFVVDYSTLGRAAAYAGATLGRVKMNGRVFKYSPLSRVLELEALSGGVMTKLRLWESLLRLSGVDKRLDAEELSRRVSDATDQLDALRRLHHRAAEETFSALPLRPNAQQSPATASPAARFTCECSPSTATSSRLPGGAGKSLGS